MLGLLNMFEVRTSIYPAKFWRLEEVISDAKQTIARPSHQRPLQTESKPPRHEHKSRP